MIWEGEGHLYPVLHIVMATQKDIHTGTTGQGRSYDALLYCLIKANI